MTGYGGIPSLLSRDLGRDTTVALCCVFVLRKLVTPWIMAPRKRHSLVIRVYCNHRYAHHGS